MLYSNLFKVPDWWDFISTVTGMDDFRKFCQNFFACLYFLRKLSEVDGLNLYRSQLSVVWLMIENEKITNQCKHLDHHLEY